MHLIGLVPALALGLASAPEDAIPQPTPAPTEPTQPVTDTPPAQQPKKGTGLLAATAVVGGASLGVTIARNVILKRNCPLDSGVATCTYDLRSDVGLGATQWTLNVATIGLAAGTGTMMGRYHAWKDAGEGRMRNIKTIRGAGGGLVGVGAAGVITSVALAFVLPMRCVDKELSSGDPLAGDRCLLKAYPTWTMTNFASFSMISSGAAMLGYGANYRSRRGAVAELRFNPFAGRTFAGIGMSGRF
ncbi:MAG: hypothetical protein H6712_05200 [Myxococcales bacterium]|nr:hypothetical protein [Myxococcales bacterium]MCB9713229.1 hypothetical protein [Myxococcales bacterium]